MTVSAWRIVKAKHSTGAFTGAGAKEFGGRWNGPGSAVIYTAGSMSLAMLEILAQVQSKDLLRRYVMFELSFDRSLVSTLDLKNLPKNWRKSPPPRTLQRIGDSWLAEGRSVILQVPSAIVPNEPNYLVNPAHCDLAKITIGPKLPARFDSRFVL